MLEPYAQACISCGTLIGANQIPETGNDDWKGSDTGFVNIFELRESANSRSVRLQFSDFAVDRTSDVLGRMIDNGVQLRSPRRRQLVGQEEGKLLTGLQTEQRQLPEIHNGSIDESESIITAEDENKSGSKQEDSDHPFKEQLRQVFFKDKGHWYLDDLNLKATSQKDAGRRVSLLLLLYAQEIDGLPQIPRELNLGIDGHTIVGEASYEDKGIIGLWAISKATDGAAKIVSAGKLTEFIYKAFVVQTDARNMARTLEAKATGKVLRVRGGYEITPSGMAHAETLVGLKPGTQAATSTPKNNSKKRT